MLLAATNDITSARKRELKGCCKSKATRPRLTNVYFGDQIQLSSKRNINRRLDDGLPMFETACFRDLDGEEVPLRIGMQLYREWICVVVQ